MLLKAIVVEVVDKYNIKVRIPRYDKIENAVFATPNNSLSAAPICTSPGISPKYKPGDVVIVGFENDLQSKPIILGHLYCIKNIDSVIESINCNDLSVDVNSSLSEDTEIDGVKLSNYIKKFSGTDSIRDANNNLFNLTLNDVENQTYKISTSSGSQSGYFGWCLTLYPGVYTITPSLKNSGVYPDNSLGSIFIVINNMPINNYFTVKCDVIPVKSGTYAGAFGLPFYPVKDTFSSYSDNTASTQDTILEHKDGRIAYPRISQTAKGSKYYLYKTDSYTTGNLYKDFEDGDVLYYRSSGPGTVKSGLSLNDVSLMYFHKTKQMVSNIVTVPEGQIYKYYILSRYNYNNPTYSTKEQLLKYTKELFSYFNFKVEQGSTPTVYSDFVAGKQK